MQTPQKTPSTPTKQTDLENIEARVQNKLANFPCSHATGEKLSATATLLGAISSKESEREGNRLIKDLLYDPQEETHEDIRRLCREIPTEQTTSQKGLARFWTTLKNLRTSLSEKSLDVAKKADEVATDYGLPLVVGSTSIVPTTQLLHYVVEASGQIPTLQTTLYPAAALAAITTVLLSIPWKETRKELHTKTNPPQNSPEI